MDARSRFSRLVKAATYQSLIAEHTGAGSSRLRCRVPEHSFSRMPCSMSLRSSNWRA